MNGMYVFLGLIAICMCVGFFKTYLWLRILAAKSNRYKAEIKEIKEMIFSLTRICMPGRRTVLDLSSKKFRD